jgi:hypothetical protein
MSRVTVGGGSATQRPRDLVASACGGDDVAREARRGTCCTAWHRLHGVAHAARRSTGSTAWQSAHGPTPTQRTWARAPMNATPVHMTMTRVAGDEGQRGWPRSHGAGRRPTPPPGTRNISESPDMGRALTKRNYSTKNKSPFESRGEMAASESPDMGRALTKRASNC